MLKEKLENIDLFYDDIFYERCELFIELLQQWGQIHNLTASLHTMKIKENIIDSLYPLTFINDFSAMLDVGTGAGYPGLILAIAKPDTKVYLCEPRLKRVAFLNFVKNTLKLQNVEVIQSRVEDISNLNVNLITSRAVTNTALLLDITKHIINDDISYLFYKGSLCEEEIKDAKINKVKVVSVGEHRNFLYIK